MNMPVLRNDSNFYRSVYLKGKLLSFVPDFCTLQLMLHKELVVKKKHILLFTLKDRLCFY